MWKNSAVFIFGVNINPFLDISAQISPITGFTKPTKSQKNKFMNVSRDWCRTNEKMTNIQILWFIINQLNKFISTPRSMQQLSIPYFKKNGDFPPWDSGLKIQQEQQSLIVSSSISCLTRMEIHTMFLQLNWE